MDGKTKITLADFFSDNPDRILGFKNSPDNTVFLPKYENIDFDHLFDGRYHVPFKHYWHEYQYNNVLKHWDYKCGSSPIYKQMLQVSEVINEKKGFASFNMCLFSYMERWESPSFDRDLVTGYIKDLSDKLNHMEIPEDSFFRLYLSPFYWPFVNTLIDIDKRGLLEIVIMQQPSVETLGTVWRLLSLSNTNSEISFVMDISTPDLAGYQKDDYRKFQNIFIGNKNVCSGRFINRCYSDESEVGDYAERHIRMGMLPERLFLAAHPAFRTSLLSDLDIPMLFSAFMHHYKSNLELDVYYDDTYTTTRIFPKNVRLLSYGVDENFLSYGLYKTLTDRGIYNCYPGSTGSGYYMRDCMESASYNESSFSEF